MLSIPIEIEDNMVVRSAKLVLDHLKLGAWVRFVTRQAHPARRRPRRRFQQRGLCSVSFTGLAGKSLPPPRPVSFRKNRSAATFRSFCMAVPRSAWAGEPNCTRFPDHPPTTPLVVSTGIHVSTPRRTGSLERSLTSSDDSPILREFQTIAWTLNGSRLSNSR